MASLNLSLNGPSINSSYQSVVNASLPTGSTASSSTYALWALFSVSAPLASAFALDNTNKESVLKVQSTGGRSDPFRRAESGVDVRSRGGTS